MGLSINTCKKYQQSKKRKDIYEQFPPKIIVALKPWNLVHINLIGAYSKSIRQQHPIGTFIKNYVILSCMKMIDPSKVRFEVVEVPCFDLYEVARENKEYI